MRLVAVTIDGDGKPGFAPWVEDLERRAATIERIAGIIADRGEVYSGVYMMAGCGRLIGKRACGYATTGDGLSTDWAGHDDHMIHETVFQMAERAKVAVQIGFPTTLLTGLERLIFDATRLAGTGAGGHTIVLDRSGGNIHPIVDVCYDAIVRAGCECRMESRPLGGAVYPDRKHVTMSKRAIGILRRGEPLYDDAIFFTNGDDGNGWIEPLALGHERRGCVVCQPLETIE